MTDLVIVLAVAAGVPCAICAALLVVLRRRGRLLKKLSRWRSRLPIAGGHFPVPRRYEYVKPFTLLAHRGLARYAVENTGPAIQLAAIAGCNGVEVDVRFTKDTVPVIFHDRTLDRLALDRRAVDELAWSELSSVPIAPANRIMSLDAFLDELAPAFERVMLDLKDFDDNADNRARVEAVAQAVRRRGAAAKTIVDCASPAAARHAAELGLTPSLREPAGALSELSPMGIRHVSMGAARARGLFERGSWAGSSAIVICPPDAQQVAWFVERGAFAVITDAVEESLSELVRRGHVAAMRADA